MKALDAKKQTHGEVKKALAECLVHLDGLEKRIVPARTALNSCLRLLDQEKYLEVMTVLASVSFTDATEISNAKAKIRTPLIDLAYWK